MSTFIAYQNKAASIHTRQKFVIYQSYHNKASLLVKAELKAKRFLSHLILSRRKKNTFDFLNWFRTLVVLRRSETRFKIGASKIFCAKSSKIFWLVIFLLQQCRLESLERCSMSNHLLQKKLQYQNSIELKSIKVLLKHNELYTSCDLVHMDYCVFFWIVH